MSLETGDLDLHGLVSRLKKGGSLSRNELNTVRERLKEHAEGDDLYALARALSLGSPPATENVRLLEPFLTLATDDWGLHGVINALCLDWGLTSNYLDRLLEWASPPTWETHQSTAIAALSAIGAHLQSGDHRAAVSVLLQYLDSDSTAFETPATRRLYVDQVWGALDLWLRGPVALVQPSRFDADSDLYKALLAKFQAIR